MSNIYTVFDCHIFHFNKISSRSGNLTPIQNDIDIPFAIKRVYYYMMCPEVNREAHTPIKIYSR
jgi:hypothetical protein